MTVQELIDALLLIEDKSLEVKDYWYIPISRVAIKNSDKEDYFVIIEGCDIGCNYH